jgi:hypothetical protein
MTDTTFHINPLDLCSFPDKTNDGPTSKNIEKLLHKKESPYICIWNINISVIFESFVVVFYLSKDLALKLNIPPFQILPED